MASTQTQPSLDVAMRTSFTMDRFSGSGRTDSTIDDSPFGSALNTPLDEDVREPFEAIGKKLEELQTHRDAHNMDLKGEIVPPEQAIDEDSERQELSLISSSRPDHLQEKISQVIQSQENEQTSSHKSTTSLLSADDISHVAAEDNFDSSSVNSFDTSAISDRLLASFPTVPFSSPEVPNDQVMFNSPVPFTTELSRSLYNIQTQSLESSPALNLNNQNNISPDGSPVFFSPEIDQGFSVHTRESSLYNLPNAPITISPSIAVAQSECSYYSEIEGVVGKVDLGAQASALSTQKQANECQDHPDHLATNSEPEYTFSIFRSLNFSLANLPVLFFKSTCFVPWCALVGGTILLSPTNIEKVAFSPGIGVGNLRLDYVSPPSKNIHRFAHWTECAIPQIMTFLAALMSGLWVVAGTQMGLGLAITVAAVVLTQIVVAWQDFDFSLGEHRRAAGKPLGEDDRESIWMVIRLYVLAEESKTWFMGSLENGLFIVDQRARTD